MTMIRRLSPASIMLITIMMLIINPAYAILNNNLRRHRTTKDRNSTRTTAQDATTTCQQEFNDNNQMNHDFMLELEEYVCHHDIQQQNSCFDEIVSNLIHELQQTTLHIYGDDDNDEGTNLLTLYVNLCTQLGIQNQQSTTRENDDEAKVARIRYLRSHMSSSSSSTLHHSS
mmetsp:Transcript_10277/g.29316  ORF Transcript_10277/g.29316 Transcript_10277/m.29316 type:complete len:172 (+) Transcript_10277:193-708(+)|eukprot:CAMPEP_0119557546 /NCGR_PEP_ID=MMETSP1352-20130426/9187_1 /TAXON_ID=265584 /ORGANISM="Stauroneis constricta, Strain CCMP1120" /LENGTH=171 /DNA_ID=CAMNT_0007604669 /DNA_START=93 /DNA_END=608 /DNA_ORIENTATION=-